VSFEQGKGAKSRTIAHIKGAVSAGICGTLLARCLATVSRFFSKPSGNNISIGTVFLNKVSRPGHTLTDLSGSRCSRNGAALTIISIVSGLTRTIQQRYLGLMIFAQKKKKKKK
jgi:hypothetical protein